MTVDLDVGLANQMPVVVVTAMKAGSGEVAPDRDILLPIGAVSINGV